MFGIAFKEEKNLCLITEEIDNGIIAMLTRSIRFGCKCPVCSNYFQKVTGSTCQITCHQPLPWKECTQMVKNFRPNKSSIRLMCLWFFFYFRWMDDLWFYILFNSISVILGWWEGDNEKLCAMEPCFGTTRSAGCFVLDWKYNEIFRFLQLKMLLQYVP